MDRFWNPNIPRLEDMAFGSFTEAILTMRKGDYRRKRRRLLHTLWNVILSPIYIFDMMYLGVRIDHYTMRHLLTLAPCQVMRYRKIAMMQVKVAEDDIAFKLAIFKASKLVFGSLLAKNNFFVQYWTKNFASSRMANCGSGLPAEWPFRSQNAIEASDSPLRGGLWVKRLITHAVCSLAYSDIAWCKLFLILTMTGLYWVFFAYKTPYSVLID